MQCIDEFHTGTHLWLMKEWMHTARSWSFAIKRKRNGLIWIPTLGKQAGCWWRAAGVAGSEKQKEDAQRRRCYGRCCAAGGRWTHAVERWCWSCAVMSKWLNVSVGSQQLKNKRFKIRCFFDMSFGEGRQESPSEDSWRWGARSLCGSVPVPAHTRRRYCCWGAWGCFSSMLLMCWSTTRDGRYNAIKYPVTGTITFVFNWYPSVLHFYTFAHTLGQEMRA